GSQILQSVVTRQERQLDSIRSVRAPVDVSRLSGLTWQGVRVEAARVVSLGALAEGGHGSPAVARSAAAFLERFARVCGCLHAGFSGVAPSIRLTWTEILSQFDEPP